MKRLNSLTSCNATIDKLLLYGDESLDLLTNTLILNVFVDFILSSKKFYGPLIQNYLLCVTLWKI